MDQYENNKFLYKLYKFINYNEENNINCINWYETKDKQGFIIKDCNILIKNLNEKKITMGKIESFRRQLNYYNIYYDKSKIYYHKNNLFYKGKYKKLNKIKRDNYKKRKITTICSECKKRKSNLEIDKKKKRKTEKERKEKTEKMNYSKKFFSVDILKITKNFLNLELERLKKDKIDDDMKYLNYFNSKKIINEMFDKTLDEELFL